MREELCSSGTGHSSLHATSFCLFLLVSLQNIDFVVIKDLSFSNEPVILLAARRPNKLDATWKGFVTARRPNNAPNENKSHQGIVKFHEGQMRRMQRLYAQV